MVKLYGKMMENAYGTYYERFRILNATERDNAVTRAELFPEGESYADGKIMHQMLSSRIVKRDKANTYWLDESVVSNPGKVLLNRFSIIVGGVLLALVIIFVREHVM